MTRAEKLHALSAILADLNGDATMTDVLDELAKMEEEDTLESIRRGLRDVEEGRTVPFDVAAAKLRGL